jgi:hypothetical protein
VLPRERPTPASRVEQHRERASGDDFEHIDVTRYVLEVVTHRHDESADTVKFDRSLTA